MLTMQYRGWAMTGIWTAAVLALGLSTGCKQAANARHVGTVSVVAVHSTLSEIQDTEGKLVCGRVGAPPEPVCVPDVTHRQIAGKLAQAFQLDADLARAVRAMPTDAPTPAQVFELVAQVNALIKDIMALIPDSPAKTQLGDKIAWVRSHPDKQFAEVDRREKLGESDIYRIWRL